MKINLSKITSFLKEARMEVKKVNWPSREETIKYTLVVIGSSLAVAAFLGGLDFIFARIVQRFVI